MIILNKLLTISAFIWLGSAVGGWVLGALGVLSYRYRRAAVPAGTAIGLVPTYLFVLNMLRRFGGVSITGTVWQAYSALAVASLVLICTGMACTAVVIAIKEENEEKASA